MLTNVYICFQGNEPRISNATVNVELVEPPVGNRPVFMPASNPLSIQENSAPGSTLFTVRATRCVGFGDGLCVCVCVCVCVCE